MLLGLQLIEKDKLMVAKGYSKKKKVESFQVGHPVWKMVLPLKTKDRRFSEWSPTWEESYKVA